VKKAREQGAGEQRGRGSKEEEPMTTDN